MSPEVQLKIGKYEVLSKIGQGGMGVVYKAKDPLIDRIVAIKKMTGSFAEDQDARERFLREARAVGRLQHPNIVTIYELGVEGNSPYMVMEYLEGEGLDRVLASGLALSLVQKLDYLAQICNALHFAHENDIIHRDVKPANVIVLKGGAKVKLVDFGIARAGGTGITRTGFAVGTTSYMSPEQIEASKGVDRRSDIFSAGVMLYEVLTNNLPFPGSEPIAVAIKILREPYPPLAAYLSEYPPELDEIMARALAKDRNERYSTAEEFAFDLSRLQEQLRRQMVSQYVVEGRASLGKKDLSKARELLSYVLKIDPTNSEARQLMYEVQKLVQAQQKSEQLRQLRANVEEAIGQRQYEEALSFVDQALKLDPSNTELIRQRELVVQEQQRRSEVKKRLNLAQSAQSAGDLLLARDYIEKALSLDPTDTHARIVRANVEQEIAEYEKQKQAHEFLESARADMAARRFTAAKEAIRQAENLQPESPEVQSLKSAAYSGHAEELRRRELQQVSTEIQGILAGEDYGAALRKIEEALQKFPSEPTLLQLKSAAERRREAVERQRQIDEHIARASRLMSENKSAEALRLVQEACRSYPEEARLQNFLATVRESAQREEAERLKNAELKRAKDALGRQDYKAAIATLEAARIEFPRAADIADLLEYAREAAARAAAPPPPPPPPPKPVVSEPPAAPPPPPKLVVSEPPAAPPPSSATAMMAAYSEVLDAEARAKAERTPAPAPEVSPVPPAPAAATPVAPPVPPLKPAREPAKMAPHAAATPAPAAEKVPPASYDQTIRVEPPPRKPSRAEKKVEERPPAPAPVPSVPAPRVAPPAEAPSPKKWIFVGAALVVVIIAAGLYFALHKTTPSPSPETAPVTGTAPGPAAPVTPAAPPAPVMGTLSVEVKDDKGARIDGADIFVDNQLKDTITKAGKASLSVVAGSHQVRVEKTGFEPATAQSVDIPKDGSGRVQFVMKVGTASAAVPPPNPYLMVTSTPGATIRVDGKAIENVGPDGHYSFQVDPGRHQVEIALRGYRPFSTAISAKAGDRVPVNGVLAAIPPPVIDFSANPSAIQEGQSTELKWETQNATEVTIEGLGPVSTKGSRQVTPRSSTAYTLIARGEGEPAQKVINVAVSAAPPPRPAITSFSASGSPIQKGGRARLEWATENATDVSIEGIGRVDARGSREVSPSETTTYVLSASGRGGSVSSSPVRVVVEAPKGPSPEEIRRAEESRRAEENRIAEETRLRDVATIKELIERQLRSAYESMSMAELQKVWPDMPKNVRDDTRNLFQSDIKNIKMSFTCSPKVSGDAASASCAQTMSYSMGNKPQPPRTLSVVFTLKKIGGAWRLQGTQR